MNVLFIGKYPPIQGGESTKAYWLSEALAARNHNICVVSNCLEADDGFRCQLDERDKNQLAESKVKLVSTIPITGPSFTPSYNPFEIKLTSLALDESDACKPDIIVSWYLMPYAVSAHMVSNLLNVPHVVIHAGSDITRLLNYPYYHRILKEILRSSAGQVTYASTEQALLKIGCLNTFNHNPTISSEYRPSEDYDWDKKSICYLGKISKGKGFDLLLRALEQTNGIRLDVYGGLDGDLPNIGSGVDVIFHDPIVPWKIPAVLNGCAAVVVPEYSFGVSAHRSRIPVESLLCGTPVIVSSDVSENYGPLSKHFEICDPTNVSEFSSLIEAVVEDSANKKAALRSSHKSLRELVGSFEDYVDSMEAFFEKTITDN